LRFQRQFWRSANIQLHLGIEALQTLTVVSIVFGSQATTYVIRGRQHLWGLRPSIWLVLSSVADVLIISTLATLGIAMAPLPIAVIAAVFGAAAVAFGAVLDVVKIPVLVLASVFPERPGIFTIWHHLLIAHEGMNMKIAFLHIPNFFTSELLKQFRTALAHHEVVEWIGGNSAPAFDFDMLLAMGYVDRKLLEGQPKLKFVQTASDGYEEVDIEAASELGIWVSYAPADLTGNATSVAEFAVLLLLAAARHLGEALTSIQEGPVKPPALNLSLSGKTVCVIGLGAIGQQLVDRLRPFGMKMLATDEHPENAPADVTAYPAAQLNAAVAHADFVVICVRASKENENLINAAQLAAMKRGAILVNIARGMLIDETALVDAVTHGQISAAGLDVLKNEPPSVLSLKFAYKNEQRIRGFGRRFYAKRRALDLCCAVVCSS
jgi:phosphoglycerate dehydrogenase-like enzyme